MPPKPKKTCILSSKKTICGLHNSLLWAKLSPGFLKELMWGCFFLISKAAENAAISSWILRLLQKSQVTQKELFESKCLKNFHMAKLRAFVTPLVQSDYKSAAKKKTPKQTTKSAKNPSTFRSTTRRNNRLKTNALKQENNPLGFRMCQLQPALYLLRAHCSLCPWTQGLRQKIQLVRNQELNNLQFQTNAKCFNISILWEYKLISE